MLEVLPPHEPRSSRSEAQSEIRNPKSEIRNSESLLLPNGIGGNARPPRPSPPGEGEARTVPGIFTPLGVELFHGDSRRRLLRFRSSLCLRLFCGHLQRVKLLCIPRFC